MTDRVLLPTHTTPVNYNIHLTPDFSTFRYTGEEKVNVQVSTATKSFTLNALDIDVKSVKVTQNDNSFDATISYDKENEYVIFTLNDEVSPGDAVIDIYFEGELNDKLAGFYRSKYKNNKGEETYLATTQFEPVDARRAFPCWDEPSLKAKFDITLTVPENMVALSNMPDVKTTSNNDGTKTVVFDTTPIISTYLIAFVIGELECIQAKTENGVLFRVWTTPGKTDMGKFALDVGCKVLTYFEEYYGVDYPLPKQDMVAIPDFSAGAMENWGLITYRETALLCTEKSSVNSRSRVAYVVSHELAHQWFGNLVTMQWWKELWLNEGFATFVGTQAVDNFFPQWESWTDFIESYLCRALSFDSLANSHPIEVDVAVARSIDEIFDAISYSKGASVIRMIENYLGKDNFRKGLNVYLNQHKYKNTVTKDLWEALSEASGKDVTSLMNTWVTKIGYPVVTVKEGEQPGEFVVTQNRFLASGNVTEEQDQTIWPINLGILLPNQEEVKYYTINERSTVIVVEGYEEDSWIKFNANQSGLFRVNYSKNLLQKLGKAVENNEIPAGDRLGLVSDLFALAKAGHLPLKDALQLLTHFKNETNASVWSTIATNIGKITELFSDAEFMPEYKKFVVELFSGIGGKLGWEGEENEGDLTKVLRATVLSALASHDDEKTIEECKKRFEAYINDKSTLSPDIAAIVFKTVMRNGGEEEYNKMVELYQGEENPELKIKSLLGIGYSRQEELIKKALEYIFSEYVRSQDIMYLVVSCSSTDQGGNITWEFVKENWERFQEALGGAFLLGRIISYSGGGFKTEEKAQDIIKFFENKNLPGVQRTVQQVVETIRTNEAFHNRELPGLTQMFKKE